MINDAIQLLLNSSLHKDTVQIERCNLVFLRINCLFTDHNETVKEMDKYGLIGSYILATALKHVSWTSDASTPVGIVHYGGFGYNHIPEQSSKILPCNEILKLIKDKISSGNSEGMSRIHTKSGHLICPSFNVQSSEKATVKMQKKLERRKIRIKEFETVSEAMLLQSEILSNMEDSDVVKWAVNYLDRIASLPTRDCKKQDLQTQSKEQNLKQIINSNNKANYGDSKEVIQTEDVSKMILDIHSSKKNSNSIQGSLENKPVASANYGDSNQVIQTEDVSKITLDIHSSRKNSNSMGSLENKPVASANIPSNNPKATPGDNSVENPVSELQNSNNVSDKIQTEEELGKIAARKMLNKKRNDRRRAKRTHKDTSLENHSAAPANITPDNSEPILGHNSVGTPATELQNSTSVSDKVHTLVAPANITPNKSKPILGHSSLGNPASELRKSKSVSDERRDRNPLKKRLHESPSSQPAKEPRMTTNTGITGDVSIGYSQHWRSTNKAVLVEGAHYICWFDSANSLFCYRMLLQTPNTVQKMRHIPYQAFKVNPIDTTESPLIRIPLEIPTMNDEQMLFMAEMKQTCVANTLPPATNAIPPWNPVYESLYIMKANWTKPLQEGHAYAFGRYMLSEVDIWKYPLKGCSKLSFQLRTPS